MKQALQLTWEILWAFVKLTVGLVWLLAIVLYAATLEWHR